jgi:hypothetical protein
MELTELMSDEKWRTVARIAQLLEIEPASVFAKLRDLKKESDTYTVERKPKDDTFKYRITLVRPKEALPDFYKEYPKSVINRFKKFHRKNPNVFTLFKELAFKMLKTGRAKYSARTIIEVIRWDRDLQTVGEVFKINGDFVPLYVRLLIYQSPEFGEFFELRKVRSRGIKSSEQKQREETIN